MSRAVVIRNRDILLSRLRGRIAVDGDVFDVHVFEGAVHRIHKRVEAHAGRAGRSIGRRRYGDVLIARFPRGEADLDAGFLRPRRLRRIEQAQLAIPDDRIDVAGDTHARGLTVHPRAAQPDLHIPVRAILTPEQHHGLAVDDKIPLQADSAVQPGEQDRRPLI